MDIGDVVAVFEAAFLAGGATAAYCPSHETRRCATHPRILTQATLSLLDRDPFAAATRAALRATGRSSEVAINATVQVGCGILYHGAAGPQEDVVGVEGCAHGICQPGDRIGRASRFQPAADHKRHCWLHGSLWWLRHWAGAFLADKVIREIPFPDLSATDGLPVSSDRLSLHWRGHAVISILFPSRARCVTHCRLFAWLQKDMRWCVARFNVCDADFDHIAALHGARPLPSKITTHGWDACRSIPTRALWDTHGYAPSADDISACGHRRPLSHPRAHGASGPVPRRVCAAGLPR